ncbi:hypothetical protein LC613_37465 [Nostoc sphaeroides CHAB 2801]|uniref:hypothetical protein n=1 Tax=Nostoc sphaeroides TaxID=446679 RepID=UPI001E38084A|nr:hypothetical protein [Nostoc sphaeroides]MCC5633193.1 hypothetical protein [Nostoc sphaeroides CHAB 2801]
MKVIVTVVEKITSEAHIDIPDDLNQSAIKQHIVDRYNSGEMLTDMNLFQVDFESISARIVQERYLVAMNGDPRKPEIAAAQSYFAIKTHEAETHQNYQPKTTIAHEAAQLAMMLGEFAGLDKSLTAQLAVNAATKVNPALKPAADELKIAIASTNTAEDAFLNPTQIGEVVGMSARAVNHCLLNSGLQYRTDDKKIPYRPTESGKQWGRMVPAVAKSSNQTVFQLRWLPEIVKVIAQ